MRLAIPFFGLIFTGCTRYVAVDPDRGPQAYYQTGFPSEDVSGELEQILRSVVQTHTQAFYDRYVFVEGAEPADSIVGLLQQAVDTVSSSQSRAGTAVVIAASAERISLLTTDHATHFPDTVVRLYASEGSLAASTPGERAIESIMVKTRETAVLADPRGSNRSRS